MLTFYFSGAEGTMTVPQVLTAGMVGKHLLLEFSPEWEGLSKTVVFSNGTVTRDMVFTGNPVKIPAEVLEEPLQELTVGVYGLGSGGDLVIPTVRARGPMILPGVKPSGDPSVDPTLPVWGQILALIGNMEDLNTETRENLVAAVNELLARLDAIPEPDKTLTLEGVAADAGAVGEALLALEQEVIRLGEMKGLFLVGSSGETATHSASRILAAAEAGMLPLLLFLRPNGAEMIPFRRAEDGKAIFEQPGISNGTARVTIYSVDAQKKLTVTMAVHENSGQGGGGDGSSVTGYGAMGDGVTDDTAAFQSALRANRVVKVPGGNYRLSGGLVVDDNCCLELAQDAVLRFENLAGNCITLNRSATLRGNHATVFVPYSFAGHVIHADTSVHESVKDVQPWAKGDPQWKTGRYLTDLNICMVNSSGEHKSLEGSSFGTAVYISANRQGTGESRSTYIWGLNFSGLRIAGPFAFGIRAYNYDSNTYNHEMRIEALVDACKVGVSLENCHKAYLSVAVQPRAAVNGRVYATQGIQLVNSRDTDLSGSRVWDWVTAATLWTGDKNNVNQHLALYGDCRGTILSDHNYYDLPEGFGDLRELIHTDTPANFDSLIILQEPVTRWFRSRENLPYFHNGQTEERLCFYQDLQGYFGTERVALFDDKLPAAVGKDGAVLNGIGYIPNGTVWDVNGNQTANAYNGCTGLIPCKQGDVIYGEGLGFENGGDVTRVLFFDANFNFILLVNWSNLAGGNGYYAGCEETEKGFKVTLLKGLSQAAYAAFNFNSATLGSDPVIAVNEEIDFSYSGILAENVKVKASAVEGLDAAIEAKLGVIENGTY